MLVFAFLFAALALLGSFGGLGFVGQPMGQHAVTGYGWSLGINGVALSAFCIFRRYDRVRQRL